MDIRGAVAKAVEQINWEVQSRAFRAANELRNSSLRVLKGQRSGRVYRRPFASGYYTASAPGEPPAVRSGDLRRSWRRKVGSEKSGKLLTVRPAIITNVPYAPLLDEGTGRMSPRPYKNEVVEEAKPKIKAIYSEPYLNK